MKFCAGCGSKNEIHAKFCVNCGKSMDVDSDIKEKDIIVEEALVKPKAKAQLFDISEDKDFFVVSEETRQKAKEKTELIISQESEKFTRSMKKLLPIIILSPVIAFIGVSLSVLLLLYRLHIIGDNWISYTNTILLVLIFSLFIGSIAVLQIFMNPKFDYNQQKPSKYYCYYVPFSRDIKEQDRTEARKYLHPKTSVIITDPFFVSRITSEWTELLGKPPQYVKWIDYPSMTNSSFLNDLKFIGRFMSGLSFALLPLSFVSPKEGVFTFRVFLRNKTTQSQIIKLTYYNFKPENRNISSPPITLLEQSVDSSSIIYKDFTVKTTVSNRSPVMGAFNYNALYFVIWTTSTSKNVNHYIVVKKVTTQTHVSAKPLALLPFLVRFRVDNLKLFEDPVNNLEKVSYLGSGNNPFVAPSAIREVLMHSISATNPVTKETYVYYASTLSYNKKFRKVFLITFGIISLLSIAVMIYALIIGIIVVWSVIFVLVLLGVITYQWITIKPKIPDDNGTSKILYKMGLTLNENYIGREDRVLEKNMLELWKEKTSKAFLPGDQIFPVDFASDVGNRTPNFAELIASTPQHANKITSNQKTGEFEILEAD